MKVLLEAPILTKSGYGEHAKLVYSAISKNTHLDIFVDALNWGSCSWENASSDINKSIVKFKTYEIECKQKNEKQQYDLQIRVGIANEFEKKAPYSVLVTAGIETDRVSANWLMKTHQGIDKIIVPSEHAKSGFLQSAYEVVNNNTNQKTELRCASPVEVVPYPVKKQLGPPLEIDFETEFNFLQISMMGPRKNIEQSITCFIEEFRDNDKVGLVLKTSFSKSSLIDREKTRSQLKSFVDSLGPKKCKIYLLHGNLTESEIHSLYTHPKIHAYFTTTHGEGYGLPLFEAAYSGLPIVATDWSGHLDFLTGTHKGKKKKLFAKIDYELKKVQAHAVYGDLILKESRWAFPKNMSVKSQLAKVYRDYGMYKSWAKSLKSEILEKYKTEDIISKLYSSIFCFKENIEPEEVKGISFCVPTNGKRLEKTKITINSIKKEMGDFPHEIIICGDISNFKEIKSVTLIEDTEAASMAQVAKLRNKAAAKSKFNTIAWCDDDIIVGEGWLNETLTYSKNSGWYVLGNRILNPDGTRHWDRATLNPHQLIPYEMPDFHNLIQTAGFFLMRRAVHNSYKWNDQSIAFSDKSGGIPEDVDLSLRLNHSKIPISFNKSAHVWHNDENYTQLENLTLNREDIKKITGEEMIPVVCDNFENIIECYRVVDE